MGKHTAAIRRINCPLRRTIALVMAFVTAGVWVPFAYTMQVDPSPSESDDEESSVPPPIFEAHNPPSWPEQQVPRPPSVSLTKHPRPPHNPAVDPAHARPTPKVPVRIRPVAPPPEHESAGSMIVNFARAQLGKPYVFGGNGPSVWDCSGLTKAAYARVGIHLPRTSEEQSTVGTRVSLSDLRKGDLVFWGLPGLAFHVGIYVGGGKIIAAQNPAVGVIEFTLDYYMPSFARRIL